ncbi:uncharacterized protein N7500_000215 [Penicillium coprophilum]|uniref:uncharacterized protein n=1 Tax=Penicillium coprophilum TaxID=36646 RepID=UPI00238A03D6|nr:uncharacterized protein N7500_000215 [Penicillium coprophilum]KAJ5177516.1 hypothetical protein N7500_000215 [Penicillium coprophilum]
MLSHSARRLIPAMMPFHLARAPMSRRTFTSTQAIFNSSKEPSAYKEGMNQYRTFMGPFAKVFLGGVFVYQVLYWTWLKLEMDEIKVAKNEKVAVLEKEVRELTSTQK